MIDLTPLDVRNKRGDFKKLMRGYDPQEVDVFLEITAERLEELVRENIVLRERSESLERQVGAQTGREQAVQEALVTAQELRADIHTQAQREADHLVRESETEARRLAAEAEANVRNLLRDAECRLELGRDALEEMERRRIRFLKAFRQLLERELDGVEVEEERAPLENRPIDLDLGGGRFPSAEVEKVSSAMESDDAPDGSEALLLSFDADEEGRA
jgi:DivIVA domain-containing protein